MSLVLRTKHLSVNKKSIITFIIVCLQLAQLAQINTQVPGASTCLDCGPKTGPGPVIMNGNGSIATSYTASACGLNFVQASRPLHQRAFGVGTGAAQPASFTVSGIPSCATILKAFLYTSTEGSSVAINANLTNPMATNSVFPMTVIGIDASNNWGTNGTFSCRADITSLISGNGVYVLSGLPTSAVVNPNDTDGATLFIVYADPNQNYTGSIVIADGCQAMLGPYAGSTISGFSVCANPIVSTNFILLSDMQQLQNSEINLNSVANTSASTNYTYSFTNDLVWNFIAAPGTAPVAGQTTANYGLHNSADAIGIVLAGMYYQTNCLSCSGQGINSNSPLCTGNTLTMSVSGAGTGLTWQGPNGFTGNSQNVSIINTSTLASGIYSVTSTISGTCMSVTTATVSVVVQLPPVPLIVSNSPVCEGATLTLGGMGGTTTNTGVYLWSGPNGFGSALQNNTFINVNLISSGIYTLVVSNGACTASTVQNIIINPKPVVAPASNSPVCEGNALQLLAVGASQASYVWLGPASFVSFSQNPVISSSQLSNSGNYQLTVTALNGCQTNTFIAIAILSNPSVSATGTSVCFGQPAVLTAVGAANYSWTGPPGFSSGLANATIPTATNVSPVIYTVTGTAANSCTGSATATLLTIALPPVQLFSASGEICAGESTTLTATGAQSYLWMPTSSPVYTLAIAPTTTSSYTVQGTSVNNCANTATISITVNVCTGISEKSGTGNGILIYPNPNSGYFSIKSEVSMQLLLVNTLGQYIKVIELNEKNNNFADITEVEEGIYYLISKDKGVSNKILIKK